MNLTDVVVFFFCLFFFSFSNLALSEINQLVSVLALLIENEKKIQSFAKRISVEILRRVESTNLLSSIFFLPNFNGYSLINYQKLFITPLFNVYTVGGSGENKSNKRFQYMLLFTMKRYKEKKC